MLLRNSPGFGVMAIGLSCLLSVACGGSDSSSGNAAAGANAGGAGPVGSAGSHAGGAGPFGSAGSSAGGAGPFGTAGSAAGGAGPVGSAGSSAGGAPASSVPGDKLLSSLSDQEFAALCKQISDYFSSPGVTAQVQEVTCRTAGLILAELGGAQTDSELKAACKAIYDPCIASPLMSSPGTCSKVDATCTATVAEFQACLADDEQAFPKLKDALPVCADLTLAGLANVPDLSAMSAACTTYKDKCPNGPSASSSTAM